MAAASLSNFTTIFTSFDLVSNLFLLVVATGLANTMAMSVRERTRELGVMRAVGFSPAQLGGFVVGEALFLGVMGGGVGLLMSYPVIEALVSKVLADQMNFPPVLIHPRVAAWAMALTAGLSLLASGLPAYRVMKLRVVEAISRVGC